MKSFLKSMLVAASVICAGQAQAASFITYTITGTANFTMSDRVVNLPITSAGTYEAVYVVPIGVGGLAEPATIEGGQYVGSSSFYFGGAYGNGLSTASAIGNRLSITEVGYSSFSNSPLSVTSFDLCLNTSTNNAFPTSGVLDVDTSCSSAALSYFGTFQSFVGTLGTITGATASISDANPGRYGINSLRITSLIPEPATWALMLAGFAMTGYALRRRRARVAFA